MDTTQTFRLADLQGRFEGRPVEYLGFLDTPHLTSGLYQLAAGSTDPQNPHTEDEIYYVLAGNGSLESAGTKTPIGPGSILFVAAGETHRFTDITDDLTILVVFGR